MLPKQDQSKQVEIGQMIDWATSLLAGSTQSPRLDAEILMGELISCSRSTIIAFPERTLSKSLRKNYELLIQRRAKGIPVAYLMGQKEFYSLVLQVSPDTLVPRPETEMLVDEVISCTSQQQKASVLDLGTGCGAIALAIKQQRPKFRVVAVDSSLDALLVAIENGARLGLEVEWICSSWLDSIKHCCFDFVVSNPPYVETKKIGLISSELSYEPKKALDGGVDGLDSIRQITANLGSVINHGGKIFFEHGYEQAPVVAKLLQDSGFFNVKTKKDLAGFARMTSGQLL
ncbi:MAG: protein-(glutamine-N5) methyltransferase, release factor-specific [Rhodospirillaceae bacterium]|nr:protein-(glutamine-N5) methyltransferase, release factor-specific [Rhodospirillaceae bacterium]|tara:strand:+ start:72 stop:935 length:864 start_codon:yes stop_codon:yes gene_type:complete